MSGPCHVGMSVPVPPPCAWEGQGHDGNQHEDWELYRLRVVTDLIADRRTATKAATQLHLTERPV